MIHWCPAEAALAMSILALVPFAVTRLKLLFTSNRLLKQEGDRRGSL